MVRLDLCTGLDRVIRILMRLMNTHTLSNVFFQILAAFWITIAFFAATALASSSEGGYFYHEGSTTTLILYPKTSLPKAPTSISTPNPNIVISKWSLLQFSGIMLEVKVNLTNKIESFSNLVVKIDGKNQIIPVGTRSFFPYKGKIKTLYGIQGFENSKGFGIFGLADIIVDSDTEFLSMQFALSQYFHPKNLFGVFFTTPPYDLIFDRPFRQGKFQYALRGATLDRRWSVRDNASIGLSTNKDQSLLIPITYQSLKPDVSCYLSQVTELSDHPSNPSFRKFTRKEIETEAVVRYKQKGVEYFYLLKGLRVNLCIR
jgi:hypothetical protein